MTFSINTAYNDKNYAYKQIREKKLLLLIIIVYYYIYEIFSMISNIYTVTLDHIEV
jgi:hypothetical protein